MDGPPPLPVDNKLPRRQRGATRPAARSVSGPATSAPAHSLLAIPTAAPKNGLTPIAQVPSLPPLARLPATGMAGGLSRTTTPRVGTGAGPGDQPKRRRRRGSKSSNPDKPAEGGPSPVELPPVSARSGAGTARGTPPAAVPADPPPVDEEWEDDEPAAPEEPQEVRFGKRPTPVVTGTPREGADAEIETQRVEPRQLEFDEAAAAENDDDAVKDEYEDEEGEASQSFSIEARPLIVVDNEDIVEHDEGVSTPHRLLMQSAKWHTRNEMAHKGRRAPAMQRPTVFYENMYTGSFDKVAVVKKHVTKAYNSETELRKLHAGIALVMGLETTTGLVLRGFLAGYALLALIGTYANCSKDHFQLCFAIVIGGTMLRTINALLHFTTLLCCVRLCALKRTDPAKHRTFIGLCVGCYILAMFASSLATPVDDQLYSLRGQSQLLTVDSSNSTQPILVQGNSYAIGQGILSEDAWHAFNIIRLTMMVAGWVFTCLDLAYMFTKSWRAFSESESEFEQPPSTASISSISGNNDLGKH